MSAWVRYAGQVPALQAFVVKPNDEAAPHHRTVLHARVLELAPAPGTRAGSERGAVRTPR